MIQLAVLVISCVINGLLGLVVYSKNPRSATNRLFAVLIVTFICWSSVNYTSLHPALLPQLMWIRLVMFTAAPLCLMVFLTFTVFPSTTMTGSKLIRKLATVYTMFVMVLTLTPLVFKGLVVKGGHISPTPNFGIGLFLILAVGLISGGLWNLVTKYRHSTGNLRLQIRFVLVGLAGTFGLIILTDVIFVLAFKISSFVQYSSAFTLIFSGALAYAIIKHRLFDIRKAAARGLAYLLTVLSLAIVYFLVIFGITALVLNNNSVGRKVQLINTAVALVLALSFQRIKQFFDKISNRIFYKDAYDPQQFLDQLNKVLVAQVELQHLLSNSIAVIDDNLKVESCSFVIRATQYAPMRIISNHGRTHDERDIDRLLPKILRIHQNVVAADYLDAPFTELANDLSDKNIAAVVVLRQGVTSQSKYVGELILGPKKSGDPFTSEDIRILDIIANELVVATENALRFEEIQNFNLTLQDKVNEATRKLRQANERLKELDETKDDFISMASHQLRTPLTSVKGYLSMVLEGDAGKVSRQQREMLGQAFFSSQRMVYLIADLLNVSRLKTGKFVIEPTKVNLATMVAQEIGQLRETAAARKLTLAYDQPKDFPELILDETKTRQVIMNFADNAIYYTPAGGTVTVRLVDNPTTVELRVEDDGIGVAKSDQPHLFTKFFRADNARKARPDGTGLGLFMAKKVIVAEGGSIIFESQEGKGSTFGFVFSKSKTGIDNRPKL